MRHGPADYAWLLAGAVMITIGSGLAGIYSFRGRFVPVAFGFVLFFVGYRVSQFGVHQWPDRGIADAISLDDSVMDRGILAKRGSAIAVGPLLIGGGVTLFSQTIIDPSIESAVVAGVVSVAGYVVSHYGMMGRLL